MAPTASSLDSIWQTLYLLCSNPLFAATLLSLAVFGFDTLLKVLLFQTSLFDCACDLMACGWGMLAQSLIVQLYATPLTNGTKLITGAFVLLILTAAWIFTFLIKKAIRDSTIRDTYKDVLYTIPAFFSIAICIVAVYFSLTKLQA